jgi:hypothetical protein
MMSLEVWVARSRNLFQYIPRYYASREQLQHFVYLYRPLPERITFWEGSTIVYPKVSGLAA